MKNVLLFSLLLILGACGTSADNQESEGTTTPTEEVAPTESSDAVTTDSDSAPVQ